MPRPWPPRSWGGCRVEYFPYAPFARRIWELCAALPDPHLQQEALLQRVRQGLVDPASSRNRAELQISELERRADEARTACLAGEAPDRMTSIQPS